jgi:hypothetical protein
MLGESGPEAVIPLSNAPGGYALGGSTGATYITVHVHGSVIAERDLAETIFEQAYKKQNRNVTTGIT